MVGTIRFIALALIAVSYLITRLQKKEEHKKKPASLDFSNYEKNEAGLYPWEVDTDDSPERIPENAKRYVNKARLKRGRW